ncbi:MAG TPA: hypothetical protein VK850_04250, partial [Candidatus Binatia bacterium]|nr:hypothetical protein [Candidatus Binatia bacterium]
PKPPDGDGADIGAFELNPPSPDIVRYANTVTICWPSSPAGYTLQQTPTLSPSAWRDITEIPTDNGTTRCVSLASGSGTMFYRLSCGSVEAVDQQQLIASDNAGSADQWQSFIAGQSGWLKSVQLWLNSPKSPAPSPGTVRIYSGEDISGPLLVSENVIFTDPPRFQTFAFSFPPVVVAGRKYTIRFGAPSVSIGWVWYSPGNPYPRGQGSINPNWDYAFKTYVAPACD